MTGQQQEICKGCETEGDTHNQISLESVSGTEDDLSSTVFWERGDIVTKDQLGAPCFEFLVDEFPELIRELVVQ